MRKLYKKYVFLSLFFINPQFGFGASFDCNKDLNRTEARICSNKELSALDKSLNSLYHSKKSHYKALKNDQKEWLIRIRNKCNTEECLKTFYRDRIADLNKMHTCAFGDAITGTWISEDGEPFEEINFSLFEGIKKFASWRNFRPDMFGTWELDECTLTISHETEKELNFNFRIKSMHDDSLHLFDIDSGENLVYRKYKGRSQVPNATPG